MSTSLYMFIQYRISILFLLLFLFLFLKHRYKLGVTLFLLATSFVITAFMDYHDFIMLPAPKVAMLTTIVQIIIVQTTTVLVSKYRDFRALFVGITAASYVMFGNVMCSLVKTCTNSPYIALIVQTLLHACLLALMVLRMREDLQLQMRLRKKGWVWLCMIPVLFYVSVYTLGVFPVNINEVPLNIVPAVSVLILMIFAYVLITNLLAQQIKEHELKSNNAYLEIYAERLKREADIVAKADAATAVMRHDMRHFATILTSNIKEGETEKALDLLENINKNIAGMKENRYCENLSVNGIVSYCAGIAELNQVLFETDISLPQCLSINEFEFATVISNLLENAVIAASKTKDAIKRHAKISIHIIKKQIIVEIRNTFQGELVLDQETGLPFSEVYGGHGYGVKSVLTYAKKYGAVFDFSVENQEVVVRLLVQRN